MSFFDDDVLRNGDRPLRKRRTWLVLIVFVLLAAAGYVAANRYATDRVPLGTSVEGVSVGGLTKAAALDRLRSRLGAQLETPVEVTHNEHTYRLNAAKAGLSIDYVATLRRVGTVKERWSPRDIWNFYTHGGDHDVVMHVDKLRFEAAMLSLTRKIGRAAVEGTVAFHSGVARPVYGRTGLAIDVDAAIKLVRSLVFADHPGELPMAVRRPYVSASAVRAAMKSFGRPAMSGPVTVDIGGHRFRVGPKRFGRALKMVPSGGRLVPLVDGEYLHKVLAPAMKTIGDKPEDATVTLRKGAPHVVPAVFGAAYDDDALADAFVGALTKKGAARVARVHAAITAPKVGTAQARSWKIGTREAQVVVHAPSSELAPLDSMVVGSSQVKASDVLDAPSTGAVSGMFMAALRGGLEVPSFTAPARPVPGLRPGRQATDVTFDGGDAHWLLDVRRLGTKRALLTVWGPARAKVKVTASGHTDPVAAPVQTSHTQDCVAREGTDGFTVTLTRTGPATPSRFVSTYAPVATVRCVPPTPPASPSNAP